MRARIAPAVFEAEDALIMIGVADARSLILERAVPRAGVRRPATELLSLVSATDVEPLDWHGSADLPTLARANCLAFFPAERQRFETGETATVMMLR